MRNREEEEVAEREGNTLTKDTRMITEAGVKEGRGGKNQKRGGDVSKMMRKG